MSSIPTKCQPVADELAAAQELAADLQAEYKATANGPEKSRIFALLKSVRSRIAVLRAQLNECLNPPPPLPDLVPVTVSVSRHADGKALDAAVLVTNRGEGVAQGPFKIALGVEFISSYDQDPPLRAYREATFNVPASVTIPPGTNFTSDSMKNIPILRRPGSSMPATFDYDALVDVDNQVRENVENNNYIKVRDHRS